MSRPELRTRMLDTLFSHRPILARLLAAPMLAEREQYLRYLLAQNKCRSHVKSAASMLTNVVETMELTSPRSVRHAEIEEASRRWVAAKPWRVPRLVSPDKSKRFMMHGVGWLRFLELLDEDTTPAVPFEEILSAYVTHLVKVRRLQPSSIKSYREKTCAFLRWLGIHRSDFSAVTPDDVAQYLSAQRQQGLKIGSVATLAQRLRGFFRFAEQQGIPSVRYPTPSTRL
jgi:integrase/recombinase XerD